MELEDFLKRGAHALGFEVEDLRSRRRHPAIVEAREILAWLGVELYGFTVKGLAEMLDKHLVTASRLVGRAGLRRVKDDGYRATIKRVDSVISGAPQRVR